MTIHRFYYSEKLSVGEDVELSGIESAHALKVLRVRPGETMILLNGHGTEAFATLLESPGDRRQHRAVCRIERVVLHDTPSRPVHLYVAPPKSKSMDIVLKSATELGVSSITPILCQYGVVKLEGEGKDAWENTLIAAMKQSGNPWLPELKAPMSLEDALASSCCLGYFGAVRPAGMAVPPAPWNRPEGAEASLWVGPEGGFTDAEEAKLLARGLYPLTVGNWILRVETAVAALLACMNIRFGG